MSRGCVFVAVLLAVGMGCTYPPTQMAPVERRGERFYAQVTSAVERGDYAEAYRLCDRWLELARSSGTMINLVAGHENVMLIRWSERDLAGAMKQNDAMAEYSRRAVGEQRRAGLMHYWWWRAWLLSETGSHVDAANALAQLDRVSTQPGDRQSLPLITAWLAYNRGDMAAANAAVAAMTVDSDDDPTDLYIVARIRQSQGDAAGAERLHERIRRGARTLTRAAVVQRIARDRTTSLPSGSSA